MFADTNGHLPKWATLGNLFEASTTAFQLMLSGAFIGSYYGVLNAVRPNNIAAGLWSRQKSNILNSFGDDAKGFNNKMEGKATLSEAEKIIQKQL